MRAIIRIKDKEFKNIRNAECKNSKELSLLLDHLDKARYNIVEVIVIGVTESFEDFCVKDKNLELGK